MHGERFSPNRGQGLIAFRKVWTICTELIIYLRSTELTAEFQDFPKDWIMKYERFRAEEIFVTLSTTYSLYFRYHIRYGVYMVFLAKQILPSRVNP